MARGKKEETLELMIEPHHASTKVFTGEVFTLTYKRHEGHPNFCLTKLYIENNFVTKIEHQANAQTFAGFEAMHKLEKLNDAHFEKLRAKYPAKTDFN
jgi:hypothetical protein